MINNSPLKLERYYITNLAVKAKIGFNVKQASAVINLGADNIQVDTNIFGHKEDPTRMMCELNVSVPAALEGCPYEFSVSIVGFFQVAGASQEVKDKLVSSAEPTLLYSVAREVILSQTERGPFPGILLPVISFSGGLLAPVNVGMPAVPAGV